MKRKLDEGAECRCLPQLKVVKYKNCGSRTQHSLVRLCCVYVIFVIVSQFRGLIKARSSRSGSESKM